MFKYDNVVMSDKGTSDVVTSLSWLKIGPINNMIHMIGKLENCLARKDTKSRLHITFINLNYKTKYSFI